SIYAKKCSSKYSISSSILLLYIAAPAHELNTSSVLLYSLICCPSPRLYPQPNILYSSPASSIRFLSSYLNILEHTENIFLSRSIHLVNSSNQFSLATVSLLSNTTYSVFDSFIPSFTALSNP